VLLTEAANNTAVTARIGDTIEVLLSENPSTGYRWEVAAFDSSVVSAGESRFSPAAGGIGARGTRHMTFLVRGAGTGRIELVLRRNWEPADAVIQRWSVTVEVREGELPDPAEFLHGPACVPDLGHVADLAVLELHPGPGAWRRSALPG
jgi:inhibitor of cysteine peptidase